MTGVLVGIVMAVSRTKKDAPPVVSQGPASDGPAQTLPSDDQAMSLVTQVLIGLGVFLVFGTIGYGVNQIWKNEKGETSPGSAAFNVVEATQEEIDEGWGELERELFPHDPNEEKDDYPDEFLDEEIPEEDYPIELGGVERPPPQVRSSPKNENLLRQYGETLERIAPWGYRFSGKNLYVTFGYMSLLLGGLALIAWGAVLRATADESTEVPSQEATAEGRGGGPRPPPGGVRTGGRGTSAGRWQIVLGSLTVLFGFVWMWGHQILMSGWIEDRKFYQRLVQNNLDYYQTNSGQFNLRRMGVLER